jgi:tRNA nucleotidyltransferase/poly(A) polymerase
MTNLVLAWSDIVFDLQEALKDHTDPVYIVGGAVRDALLRQPIKDVDLVVPKGGIKLARKIANALKGDFFPLDTERDVGRAIVSTREGRLLIDVSGFRGDSLEADLRDRDFTINAMAVDLRGGRSKQDETADDDEINRASQLIDPTGGLNDALAKTIRRCNPDAITRDPIRGLRAVRQSVQFGFRIEKATLEDIRAHAPNLLEVSPERVRDEVFKLLALGKPVTALRVADRLGLLDVIFPELTPLHNLKQHKAHAYDAWNHTLAVVEALHDIFQVISPRRTDETAAQFNLGMVAVGLDRYRARLQTHFDQTGADDRIHRALVLLAALLHDVGKAIVTPQIDEQGQPRFRGHETAGAQVVAERVEALRLSSAERQRVVTLVRYHMGSAMWLDDLTPIDIYRYWKQLGEAGIDLIFLTLADYLGALGTFYDQDTWLRLIERAQALLHAWYEDRERLVEPPVLLNGTELMQALAIPPGPQIGDILERIREGQVSGTIATTEDALRLARSLITSSNGRHSQ